MKQKIFPAILLIMSLLLSACGSAAGSDVPDSSTGTTANASSVMTTGTTAPSDSAIIDRLGVDYRENGI